MKQCNKMKMVFVMCASAFVIQSVVASDEEVKFGFCGSRMTNNVFTITRSGN